MFFDLLNGKQKLKLFLLSVSSLFGDIINLALLLSFGFLIASKEIKTYAVCIAILIFFKGAGEFFFSKAKQFFCDDFTLDIRERLNREMLKTGPLIRRDFHSSEVGMIVWAEAESMTNFYSEGIPRFFSIAIIWLASIFYAIKFLPLSILTICVPFLIYAVHKLFLPLSEKANGEEAKASMEYSSACLDGVLGIKMLKSYDSYSSYRKLIKERAGNLRKANLDFLKIGNLNSRATNGIIYAYFILGAFILSHKNLSLPELVSAFLGLLFLTELFNEITGFILRRGKAKASYEQICRLIKETREDEASPLSYPVEENFDKAVEFKDVDFEYSDGRKALSNLNFSIPLNRKIGVVGLSGGGKTTLLYLLSGLYKPTNGSVKILGREVVKNNDASIKSLCSAVWQDSYIFSDTVYENIKMANSEAGKEEVESAARKANIHEFICSLPNGYDTEIGSGGFEISGGEAQRISIARAFLRDAPILLLDEVTSKLDQANVKKVEESLKELMKNRTVFSVTHDLSKVESFDEIFVIEDGRLTDFGDHKSLIARCPSYIKLCSGGAENEEQ